MYVHPAFRIDRASSLAFAAARGFGLVVACHDGAPVASSLPFLLDYTSDGSPRLTFHVARANALAAIAERRGTWLVGVARDDAYVSPDWYASPDQVPTWLYESVHLTGPVQIIGNLSAHLDALTERFESGLAPKPPWSAAAVTPGRKAGLMKAIVGIALMVETVEGILKLNQHKSDADHVAVATALGERPDAGSRQLADRMIALRPHLNYENAPALCD
ncbi:MAG: FMN-binding negative transcriptional regulator [Variibacter sp.]